METLDECIRSVEQRLVAREQALALRCATFERRLRAAAEPQRWLPAAAAGAAALAALWWLLRGSRPAAGAVTHAAHGDRGDAASDSWAPWLALAWPLLPAAWRARLSPATAAALLSVGVPLGRRLVGGGMHPPLLTVDALDLERYAGTWYEVARLPAPFEARCDDQPHARYTVHGSGLRVLERCRRDGVAHAAWGVARALPGSGNARLKVSFWPAWLRWLPLAWADHWVLYIDDGYQVAVVGDPARRHLWLLSRGRRIHHERFDQLVRVAIDRGFAVDRLIVSQPA